MLKLFFQYFIFPGLAFAAVVGLLAGWVDRKVTARLQWRVGPPWYQNFMDILKLTGKEVIVPEGARLVFMLSPYFGLVGAGLAAAMLGNSIISSAYGFTGDLFVFIYLLTMPALALILGASSSRNPLASVGASREMKLFMAYELPFLLAIVAMVIKTGSIQLTKIIYHQQVLSSNIISVSGALAFAVSLFCMQAKLGIVPFDASEAEQEIMAGVLIEYSGLLLALFKLCKAVMLYTVPLFLVVLFMGKDLSLAFLAVKYTALLVFIILVKNTGPRMRIDQAMRFFWRIPTVVAAAAVVLALLRM